jgi:hypothetical protein
MNFFRNIMLCYLLFPWSILLPLQNDYIFPLKSSPGNRYLIDQSGRPFLWIGDTAWSLLVQLSTQDADYYLENRREKGFNVILVNLIEHKFCTHAPANYYRQPPFIDRPFATPNEAYFAHVDTVLQLVSQQGIQVLLCPLYLGYNCGDEGFCAEVKSASVQDLHMWGQYVGERYRHFAVPWDRFSAIAPSGILGPHHPGAIAQTGKLSSMDRDLRACSI